MIASRYVMWDLQEAIQLGDVTQVVHLVNRFPGIILSDKFRDQDGNCLNWALRSSSEDSEILAFYFLQKGVNPSIKTFVGKQTTVHQACRGKYSIHLILNLLASEKCTIDLHNDKCDYRKLPLKHFPKKEDAIAKRLLNAVDYRIEARKILYEHNLIYVYKYESVVNEDDYPYVPSQLKRKYRNDYYEETNTTYEINYKEVDSDIDEIDEEDDEVEEEEEEGEGGEEQSQEDDDSDDDQEEENDEINSTNDNNDDYEDDEEEEEEEEDEEGEGDEHNDSHRKEYNIIENKKDTIQRKLQYISSMNELTTAASELHSQLLHYHSHDKHSGNNTTNNNDKIYANQNENNRFLSDVTNNNVTKNNVTNMNTNINHNHQYCTHNNKINNYNNYNSQGIYHHKLPVHNVPSSTNNLSTNGISNVISPTNEVIRVLNHVKEYSNPTNTTNNAYNDTNNRAINIHGHTGQLTNSATTTTTTTSSYANNNSNSNIIDYKENKHIYSNNNNNNNNNICMQSRSMSYHEVCTMLTTVEHNQEKLKKKQRLLLEVAEKMKELEELDNI